MATFGRRASMLARGLLVAMTVSVVVAPAGRLGPERASTAAARSATAGAATVMAATAPTATAPTATAIVPGSVDRTSLSLVATYAVSLRLRYDPGTIRVAATLEVTNAASHGIDRLELNTIAARLGRLRLGPVTVDGRPVRTTTDDQTILVPLGGVLPPGATTLVRISYDATLRRGVGGSDWLFAKANGIVDLYRWIPWLSLRRPFDRPNNGDPFLTIASPLVRVTVTTDRPLVIAAAGQRVAASLLSQTFEARDVRDFAIAASPSYRITSAQVGSVTVRVLAKPGFPAATVLRYARTAVARMGALVGAYPYSTYTVAQSAGGDGMEAPQLSWIPAGVSGSHLHWLVTHETAHQWFYGLVGSDQARQPFADEAAADELARYVSGIRRGSRCATARLDLAIYAYSNACYFETVYVQGSSYLDGIRVRIGNATFWAALRAYVADHRLGIATTRDLLAAIDDASPVDLRPLFHARFPSLF